MEITSEYIDAQYNMRRQLVINKIKELDWMDVFLNELKNKIKNIKRLQQQQEGIYEKEKTLKQHLEKVDSLKETLECKKQRVVEIEEDLKKLECVKEDALKELKAKEEHVKDVWKAQRNAMLYYKDNLGIQLKVVDDVIKVKFISISKDENKKYLVNLNFKNGKWSCLDLFPKFKGSEAYINLLKDTNDIQGFLVGLRKEFKEIHNRQ